MLISLVKYIRGFVKIQITGYSPERFINLCTSKKIFIWNIKEVSNGYSMYDNSIHFIRIYMGC